jgi:hypothetical protein
VERSQSRFLVQVVAWADVPRDEAEVLAHHPQLARFFAQSNARASRYGHVGCDAQAPLRPRRWQHVTSPQDGRTSEFDHFKALEAQVR